MAITLVVETGAGLSNANVYRSVADADTYHENHSGSTDWSGAENADKEKAKITASQYLDIKYSGRWRGTKASSTQAKAWPRIDVYDDEGYYIPSTEIPQQLGDAEDELALKIIEGDNLFEDIDTPGDIASERNVLGPLEESITYVAGKSQTKKYTLIEALLKPLLDSSETLMSRG